MSSIEWVLGLRVKITTLLDNSISGTVYSFCLITNTVTLIEDGEQDRALNRSPNGRTATPPAQNPNMRIIKLSFIKDVSVIETPPTSSRKKPDGSPGLDNMNAIFAQASPKIGAVSLQEASRREAVAISNHRQLRFTKGVGVSPEGQEIFDVLFRTLSSCKWQGKSIIVLDEVRVDPPYTAESCIADKESSSALALVRKIVKGSREKMEVKGG